MKITSCVVAGLLAAASVTGWAQQPSPGGPGGPGGPGQQGRPGQPGGDPIGENFFPPEMVMQNQKAIGLTADQQKTIREQMQKVVAQFTDLQWQQSAEQETMVSLVKQEHPDEKQVLAQLDKLMAIEGQIKRLHLSTMIKIKGILTPEQQAKLRELRPQPRPMHQGPMPGRAGGPQPPDAPPRPPDAGEQ